MNVLVIGGNGFIGSHLVDHLLSEGHNVRVYDAYPERYRKPLVNVDYRIFALNNITALYEALLGIDMIFHLANSSVPSTSNLDPVSDIQNNVVPMLNVLDLMLKVKIKRIVFFSSGGAVYGDPLSTPIKEDHPLNPVSSYGIVKAIIEKYLFLYQRTFNIEPLILRPSNPYGPRQGHYIAQGVISTFLRKIKQNEKITVLGDPSSIKDYIFITDLIKRSYELSVSNQTGAFNLGSGVGASINQIIQQVEKITEKKAEIEYLVKPSYDVNNFILDIGKAKKYVSDFTAISLEQGVAALWDWLKKQD